MPDAARPTPHISKKPSGTNPSDLAMGRVNLKLAQEREEEEAEEYDGFQD
jgi:hypothetical protein